MLVAKQSRGQTVILFSEVFHVHFFVEMCFHRKHAHAAWAWHTSRSKGVTTPLPFALTDSARSL